MRTPLIGSLFAGYGGLELGVQAVIGGHVSWCSEIDKGALKVLRHRYPDTPNVGDVTTVDWTQVEPVDVLTGGFPCQDVSPAGKRAGLRPGTRSGLWSQMAYAIDQLRPSLVVAENVRGLLSAEAHSDVEPCPWCMGDGEGFPPLRALGAVLGDLADLGYDAAWHGLRAADVGAPHGRFRVFIVAHPRSEARNIGPGLRADEPARDGRRQSPRDDRSTLLPTPTGRDHKGRNQRDDDTCLTGAVLDQWGDYTDAIRRWEHTLGRPAPSSTSTSTRGNPQLSPVFVEWMMGLPAGWVTDVPGITRSEALKSLGNGVVPQQAEAALRLLLPLAVAA